MDPSVFDGVTGKSLKDVSELDMLLIQKGASRCSLLLGHWVTGPVIFIELSCRMPAEIWSKSFGVSLLSLWSVCGLPILPIRHDIGLSWGSLWSPCFLPYTWQWPLCGFPAGSIWPLCGLYMVSLWSSSLRSVCDALPPPAARDGILVHVSLVSPSYGATGL